MSFGEMMSAFSGFVWSTPTALLLTGAGLLFTIMTLGIQWKALTHGLKVIRGDYDDPEVEGNISHFQALCAALSATIGLGNIAGVAVAVAAGGPGAVFWMWVVGFLGMATKFTTCSLATMFRKRDSFGEYRGGPMYFIELGLGRNSTTPGMRALAKTLAVAFAVLGMCASVGAGNMFQANQVAEIFVNLFHSQVPGGIHADVQLMIKIGIGIVICILAGLVMIGGITRIGNVASKLVPSMCILYVAGSLVVIVAHLDQVPAMFVAIFEDAFSFSASQGAFLGVAVKSAIIHGVRRACFSNEAGLGSAPIAHATAKTNEPIREGVVAATGPFVDTIVICTMTALVILITDAHVREPVGSIASYLPAPDGGSAEVHVLWTDAGQVKKGDSLLIKIPTEDERLFTGRQLDVADVVDGNVVVEIKYSPDAQGLALRESDARHLSPATAVYLDRVGVNMTAFAFDRGFPGVPFGTYFIPIAALFFAFSTIISWGFYGETCTEYLFGERAVLPFKFIYVGMIVVGTASRYLQPVLDWSDGMLGLMLVPNLIGTILLAPVVMRETKRYFTRLKNGEFDEDVRRIAEAKRRRNGAR
ncbi:MAG: alanine:cation symporter family protein [Phycisphaerales bacterium]|nr:MAG: alanine:cation symporter family protein [Phycisphaerales bacterium]